jgi:hypothetical protein
MVWNFVSDIPHEWMVGTVSELSFHNHFRWNDIKVSERINAMGNKLRKLCQGWGEPKRTSFVFDFSSSDRSSPSFYPLARGFNEEKALSLFLQTG